LLQNRKDRYQEQYEAQGMTNHIPEKPWNTVMNIHHETPIVIFHQGPEDDAQNNRSQLEPVHFKKIAEDPEP